MPQAKAKRAKYPFMDFAPDFSRGLFVAFWAKTSTDGVTDEVSFSALTPARLPLQPEG